MLFGCKFSHFCYGARKIIVLACAGGLHINEKKNIDSISNNVTGECICCDEGYTLAVWRFNLARTYYKIPITAFVALHPAPDIAHAFVAKWDQIPAARAPKSRGNPSQKRSSSSGLAFTVWGKICVRPLVCLQPSFTFDGTIRFGSPLNTSLSRMPGTDARY